MPSFQRGGGVNRLVQLAYKSALNPYNEVINICLLFSGARQAKSNISGHDEADPVSILHPDVGRAESLIRNAWADAKLVAD